MTNNIKKSLTNDNKDMRQRVAQTYQPYTVSGNTNFIAHLERFEQADAKWIREINEALEK